MKDKNCYVIEKIGNYLQKLKMVSIFSLPNIIMIFVFYNYKKVGGAKGISFWLYTIVSFLISVFFFKIVFKRELSKEELEYERFNKDIQKAILKRNPIENRKEMEKVLVEYCRREANRNRTSVEKIILALIEQYRGEMRISEISDNVTVLAYSLICCGATILASYFLNFEDSKVAIVVAVANVATAAYGFIFLGFALFQNLRNRKLIKGEKRGNYGYILSFLENCINVPGQLEEIEKEVEHKVWM